MATQGRAEDTALDPEILDDSSLPSEEGSGLDPSSRFRFAAVRELLETYEDRKPPSYTPEFKFFQLVRLLERLQPERAPVGRFANPHREIVRFAAHQNLSFPASQVQELQWREGTMPIMVVNFFGITGPMGVLPHYYTELIRERFRQRDHTMAAFLDIFNHRMISLFYQAWEKYRFTVAYERGERDRFSGILMDVIGLGTPGLQGRQDIPDDGLLFYAGLLAMHTRPAAALRQILWDYFDVPVELEQMVGAWYPLDVLDQCQFERGNTISEQMGVGAIVGDEIWDQQSGVLIRLGPLPLKRYLEFLPTGSAHTPLKALLKFFSGWQFDFQVQLVLEREETPPCALGAIGDEAPRLGWVSWAKSQPMDRNPDDTILRI